LKAAIINVSSASPTWGRRNAETAKPLKMGDSTTKTTRTN